jgi:hypothetical protein
MASNVGVGAGDDCTGFDLDVGGKVGAVTGEKVMTSNVGVGSGADCTGFDLDVGSKVGAIAGCVGTSD